MARSYQPKVWRDGTPNDKWKADTRKGDRHRTNADRHKTLRTGTRALTKWKRAHFVAWDGEGAAIAQHDGTTKHEYILLCNSEGLRLHNAFGLPTRDALAAMLHQFTAHADAIHVAYYFGYDVNMILRDVPQDVLRAVWSGEWVWFRGFSFQWRPGKCFSLSGYVQDGYKLRKVSGTIWDVGGFFQAPFVSALKSYNVTDAETVRDIASMKLQRSTFRPDMLPEITRYCERECALLTQLCVALRANFDAAGLRMRRWDGAGAAATALLERENVKAYKKESPEAVRHAAQYAYFGGRVELLQYGHTREPIYHYDINSAYPAATENLPCLACGYWEHIGGHTAINRALARGDFAVWHVRYHFASGKRLYPYPWRADNGAIYFPQYGEGWYWTPEVFAAQEWCDSYARDSTHTIVAGWRYVSRCAHTPFAFIRPLYDKRREWKRAKNGAEKAAKLAINSLYGKCAQTVGYSKTKAPTHHCLEWAGWITATTRAKLFRASWEHDDDVIAFATDAVFSRAPLALPTSHALGEWDAQEHTGGTFVQSGVYWLDEADGTTKGYSRGFDLDSLSRTAVLSAWKRNKTEIGARLTRFIGLGSVVNASDGAGRWHLWRTWNTQARTLRLTPLFTKRSAPDNARPSRGLVRTVPALPPDVGAYGLHSAPRRIPWSSLAGVRPTPADELGEIAQREADECWT